MPEPDRIRSFIAVPISEEVKRRIEDLQNTLRRSGISLRWVSVHNLHFTLKFLGDIDPSIVEPLGECLQNLARGTSPFDLKVGGIGAFSNFRQPRVLWVGLQSGTDPLVALAREVSAIVDQFPTQADRKAFKPHLTIARNKDRRPAPLSIPPQLMQECLGEYTCDRILLIKSILAPGGPQYTLLVDAPLESSKPI